MFSIMVICRCMADCREKVLILSVKSLYANTLCLSLDIYRYNYQCIVWQNFIAKGVGDGDQAKRGKRHCFSGL